MTQLPHRFREAQFRYYEPIIKHIVEVFPAPVPIDPTVLGKSPITVACRLRDAIRSLKDNMWQTQVPDRFYDICDLIVISEQNGKLLAGDKANIQMHQQVDATPISGEEQEVEVKHLMFISMLARLVDEEVLHGPFHIKYTGEEPLVNQPAIWARDFLNVVVRFEPPNIFHIL